MRWIATVVCALVALCPVWTAARGHAATIVLDEVDAVGADGAPAEASCPLPGLTKIVVSIDDPGVPADHFSAQPKTFWRMEERYGRVEEEPNPESGIHLLIVVNEPDIWMVNRMDGAVQHHVDPGPTYSFHLPIIGESSSEFWTQLEFGCEVDFMKRADAEVVRLGSDGRALLEHEVDGIRAGLYLDENGSPRRIEIKDPETGGFALDYLEYRTGLKPDLSLFESPDPSPTSDGAAQR